MGEASYVRTAHEERVTVPAGGYTANQVVQAPSGRAAVVQSIKPMDEGEEVALATCGQFEVPSASATVFAAGDTVNWDNTNKLAITGAGDFSLGIAAKGKANGETSVTVILNDL
jgi:predicted RecA/RadA family phage recombinase